MAPLFGHPNFIWSNEELREDSEEFETIEKQGLKEMALWYFVMLVALLLTWLFVFFFLRLITLRQKTRTPPQRRMYVGSRARPSLSQNEPTIYVSPNNLPPPPKYECLAPPSYEEVVGIHYPQYQNQPITQPITSAMAQSAPMAQGAPIARVSTGPVNVTVTDPPPTVITVTSDSRTSVQVATS